MTEYELVDAMASLNSNLLQGQAVTITLLTAYMVIAYTAGTKLTAFQCVFASIVFLIFGILGVQGQVHNLNEMYHYGVQLAKYRGEIMGGEIGELARWVFIGVRGLLLLGALLFMWNVRHPKTE